MIEATVQMATRLGLGTLISFAALASAVLYNGLGRYDAARDAAWRAWESDDMGRGLLVPELAEAAARIGDAELIQAALNEQSERTRVTPDRMGARHRGPHPRSCSATARAADGFLPVSRGRAAGRTPGPRRAGPVASAVRGVARCSRGRRMDAREQLRTAHPGCWTRWALAAFVECAPAGAAGHRETVRKRTVPAARIAGAGGALTAQEAQVARLARDGRSNPEIGARLFISPRTAAYHLSNVFTKLGIGSRSQLDRAARGAGHRRAAPGRSASLARPSSILPQY